MTASTAPAPASRPRVVGSIVAGSVLVGALGAAAGVAFDPDPHRRTDVVQPTAGPVPRAAGALGASASPARVGRPWTDAVGAPSAAGGSTVTLLGDVRVAVPAGWEVTGHGEANATLADGKGNVAFALAGRVDPGSTAPGLISANLPGLLPTETYTQQVLIGMGDIAPFGTVTSAAYLEYEAQVADNQGSLRLHGQVYCAVRRDGLALLLLVEHAPAESWNESGFPAIKQLVNDTYGLFASGG